MKPICPYHKVELTSINKYMLICVQIIKKDKRFYKCPHIQYEGSGSNT